MPGWWQTCLGEEEHRGSLRMNPEYKDIWFFMNTHVKASIVEEAVNVQVKSLACPLHVSLLLPPGTPVLPSDLMNKVGALNAASGNVDFSSPWLIWLLFLLTI